MYFVINADESTRQSRIDKQIIEENNKIIIAKVPRDTKVIEKLHIEEFKEMKCSL